MIIEVPQILADRLAQLSPTELEAIRKILTSPTYLKLLSMAECMKPSANVAGGMASQRDAFSDSRANTRLAEIRGWEMHNAAILAAIAPKVAKETLSEDWQLDDPSEPKKPKSKK